jgi:hypothetical protein
MHVKYENSIPATRLDRDHLAMLLHEGANGVFLQEAAVRLIVRHEYWLKHEDFLEFVVVYGDPPETAGIDWIAALRALDGGELRAEHEEASLLRIAGSIGSFYPICLRDMIEGIDLENIKHIAEAIMYADGFLGSVAQPKP